MNKLHTIKYECDGVGYTYELYVYDTPQELRKDIEAYYKDVGIREKVGDVAAIVHPFTIFNTYGVEKPDVGIVRVCKANVGAGIMSHEMTHLAAQIYRRRYGDLNLGSECDEHEELFAKIVGDLMFNVTNLMIEEGYWR